MRKPQSVIVTPMEVGSGRIKGAAFREFVRWYGETRGATALRDAATGAGVGELLEQDHPALGVVPSIWYEADVVHRLLDAMTAGLSGTELRELADDGSAAVMRQTLRGVYRVLFNWMANPVRYARYGPRLWDAYYDSGVFSIQMPSDRCAISRIRDWETHHPFICELNRGAARAIYSAMGCRGVRVERQACVARGDSECRFSTTWDA
jgi:hypothetical protein